jgi:hypothetical protein
MLLSNRWRGCRDHLWRRRVLRNPLLAGQLGGRLNDIAMPLLSLYLGSGFSVDSVCHLRDRPALAFHRREARQREALEAALSAIDYLLLVLRDPTTPPQASKNENARQIRYARGSIIWGREPFGPRGVPARTPHLAALRSDRNTLPLFA